MMNEQELLAVLDMSEEEQYNWVYSRSQIYGYVIDPGWETKEFQNMSLADLAFRLRDEVLKADAVYWEKAVYLVYKEAHLRPYDNVCCWMTERAKSIHWIIAALIAKDKEENEQ